MKARLERPRTIVVLSLVVAAACALAWVVTRVLPCEGASGSRGRRRLRRWRIVAEFGRLEKRGRVAVMPVSWTVTLEITGWVSVVAGHLGLKRAVLKAVRCRAPPRPGLSSVR
jgi:hypothetical protein